MSYQPIESYGMIGDMHTVALVGTNGSIDWLCVPDFDSPTVFAAILDHGKGGRFKIAPVGDDVTCKQFYWPEADLFDDQSFDVPWTVTDLYLSHLQVGRRLGKGRCAMRITDSDSSWKRRE